jgi:DNA-binding MarR family transcriptional regulator
MIQFSSISPLSNSGDFEWRTRNIGYLLSAATARCVRDKLRVVHENGFDCVTEAQLTLFHNLPNKGDRLTNIAVQAGVTKQSMIELVDKAETLALVERFDEANDKRAKIIGFTPRGRQLLEVLRKGVGEAEGRIAKIVGAAFLETLRARLSSYGSAIEVRNKDEMYCVPSDAMEWRTNNIGRILSFAARRFVKDVLANVHERGNRDVTEIMLPLLRNLDIDGSRLTEIASRAHVTKQSMQEMVDKVEQLGLIKRAPDPTDKRAKCIMFTANGLNLLGEMRRGVAHAETIFRSISGDKFADDLQVYLPKYVGAK